MFSLNELQQKAVDAQDKNVIIMAAAGSGKTSTMIAAIEKYQVDNPFEVVDVITFTNKAKDEILERLNSILYVNISTIHSWCYRWLKYFAAQLDLEVKLLDDNEIKAIIKHLKPYSARKLNDNIIFSYLTGVKMDLQPYTERICASIKDDYITYKRKNGLYDFTDLPLLLLEIMEAHDLYIDTIPALFVDEFQDTDVEQVKIFDRVKSKKKFYIGDVRQSIYIFRGAVPEILDQLEEFSVYDLTINYRSYQEIINFASTYRKYAMRDETMLISDTISFKQDSDLQCDKGYGGKIYVQQEGNFYVIKEDKISHTTEEVFISNCDKKNCTVLCRTNKNVKRMQALGYENAMTVHQAKGLEFDNVIVVDNDSDNIEEININYVALTRARNKMLIASIDFFENVEM